MTRLNHTPWFHPWLGALAAAVIGCGGSPGAADGGDAPDAAGTTDAGPGATDSGPTDDAGADAGVDAGLLSGPISGHCNRLRWRTSGALLVEPQADAVVIGSWSDDGGFTRHAITVLDGGAFRCDQAPPGEVLAGFRGADGHMRWIVTDSRELDLDFLAMGVAPGPGLPPSAMTVLPDGGLDGGGRFLIYSPETASSSSRFTSDDGGMTTSFHFDGFPSLDSQAVQSWAYASHTESRFAGGVGYDQTFIGGWTTFFGIPTNPVMNLSTDRAVSVSVSVAASAFGALPSPGPASALRYYSIASLGVVPHVPARPNRLGTEGLMSWTLGNETTVPLMAPTDTAHDFVARNPFPGTGWAATWYCVVSVRTTGTGGRVNFQAMSSTPLTACPVTLAPPTNVRIDGVDALTPGLAFATGHPEVTWTASTGPVDGYLLYFLEGGTTLTSVLRTRSTSVRLPPAFITGGGALAVVAVRSPSLAWQPHPPVDFETEGARATLRSAIWATPMVP